MFPLLLELACSETGVTPITPASDEKHLPMSQLVSPCLPPGVEQCAVDPATMDYAADCVALVESAQAKFVTAVDERWSMNYQDLVGGQKPFTVLAIYQDDHGNYKSRAQHTLALTPGDYFAEQTQFPLPIAGGSFQAGYVPQVPPGEWMICRAQYVWTSCPEAGWLAYAARTLDTFAGEQTGTYDAASLLSQNDLTGEFIMVRDDSTDLCPEPSTDMWTVGHEAYEAGGKGFAGLYYDGEGTELVLAQESFDGNYNALEGLAQGLAIKKYAEEGDISCGAFYCEDDVCYDVDFE